MRSISLPDRRRSKFSHVLIKRRFSVRKRPTIFKQLFLRADRNVSFPKVNPISAQFRTIGNKTRTRSWFANDWIQIMDILIKWQDGFVFLFPLLVVFYERIPFFLRSSNTLLLRRCDSQRSEISCFYEQWTVITLNF